MRINRLHFVLVLLTLSVGTSWGQVKVNSAQQDSLFVYFQELIDSENLSEEQVQRFIEVDKILFSHNPTQTAHITRQILLYAEEQNLENPIQILLNRMGVIYKDMGLHENAYHYFLRDKVTLDQEGAPKGMGYIRIDIGNVFFKINDYQEAKSWYLEAYTIADSSDLNCGYTNRNHKKS